MKYVNKEIISSVVTGVLITLILYYFNRNDDIKVPLKTLNRFGLIDGARYIDIELNNG